MIINILKIIGLVFILLVAFVFVKSGVLNDYINKYSSDETLEIENSEQLNLSDALKEMDKIDIKSNLRTTHDITNKKAVYDKVNEKHSCLMEEQPQLISITKITDLPTGNIYISDLYTAKCNNVIKKYSIKGVINVSPYQYDPIAQHHMIINILDEPNTNLAKHFDKVHAFIDERLSAGENVLVHCHAGISRSVSMVISYLMKKNKTNYHQTWLQVRAKRPQAEPNFGFVEQLKKYEQELGN
jgi:hypothetical protein